MRKTHDECEKHEWRPTLAFPALERAKGGRKDSDFRALMDVNYCDDHSSGVSLMTVVVGSLMARAISSVDAAVSVHMLTFCSWFRIKIDELFNLFWFEMLWKWLMYDTFNTISSQINYYIYTHSDAKRRKYGQMLIMFQTLSFSRTIIIILWSNSSKDMRHLLKQINTVKTNLFTTLNCLRFYNTPKHARENLKRVQRTRTQLEI